MSVVDPRTGMTFLLASGPPQVTPYVPRQSHPPKRSIHTNSKSSSTTDSNAAVFADSKSNFSKNTEKEDDFATQGVTEEITSVEESVSDLTVGSCASEEESEGTVDERPTSKRLRANVDQQDIDASAWLLTLSNKDE